MAGSEHSSRLGTYASRYVIVGVLNTAAHFAVTALLVELGLLQPVPASVVGFIVAVIIAFYLNSYWTFGATDRPVERLMKFLVVSMFGLCLNTLVMHISVDLLQWHYLFGLMMVVLVVPPSNFLLNLYWSFRK